MSETAPPTTPPGDASALPSEGPVQDSNVAIAEEQIDVDGTPVEEPPAVEPLIPPHPAPTNRRAGRFTLPRPHLPRVRRGGATASPVADPDLPSVVVPAEPTLTGKERRAAARTARKDAAAAKKAAAAAKKAAKKRPVPLGVRYGGGRRRVLFVTAWAVLATLASLVALMTALNRPSKSDIAALVDKQLVASGRDFPSGDAVMWAGQALRVWGTWDEATAEGRRTLLAPYLSSGLNPDGGWNARGTQSLIYSSVNPEPEVIDANHAMVSAAYQVQDGSWRCVTLPVYAYRLDTTTPWAFALSANPTPTPCAPRTGSPDLGKNDPLTAGGLTGNSAVGMTLAQTFLPAFFAAYAASDPTLTQYTAPGVTLYGLGGSMASMPPPTIGDVSVYVPDTGPVDGVVYKATVPVTWTLAGAASQVTSTYVVPVVRNSERWLVAGEPQPSMQDPVASGGPAGVPAPGTEVVRPTYNSETPTGATTSGSSSSSTSPSSSESKPSKSTKSSTSTKKPSGSQTKSTS